MNDIVIVKDALFLLGLSQLRTQLEDIRGELDTVFKIDQDLLKKELRQHGLSAKYSRLQRDWEYRISQAYLRPQEFKQTKAEKFICVAARAIICEKVATEHLNQVIELIPELQRKTSFMKSNRPIEREKIDDLLKACRVLDRLKGYIREIHEALDDYCHFCDFAAHILGKKAELYGKRFRADVYLFQLNRAIEELFVSRTPSCDAAAFLIRSHLEIPLRRLIFKSRGRGYPVYLPKKNLDASILLKACKSQGIEFNCSYDTLQRLYDNLNLVLHYGFKLNAAMLWYMFYISRGLSIVVDNSIPAKQRENWIA